MPKHKHHSSKSEDPSAKAAITYVVVDGIEGQMIRVELPDGSTADWDRDRLPTGVKEGDVISIRSDEKQTIFEIDQVETAQRHNLAQSELDALNQDAPRGEIDL